MNHLSKYLILIALVLVFLTGCMERQKQSFSVAFYNVENLFDTIDNANVSDDRGTSVIQTEEDATDDNRYGGRNP